MLKLKLQYFGHLMRRADSLEKTWCWKRLRAEEGDRGWDSWMASLTQRTWVCTNSRRWWRTGKPGLLQPMESQRVGHNWVTEQQQQSNTRWLRLPAWLDERTWVPCVVWLLQLPISSHHQAWKHHSRLWWTLQAADAVLFICILYQL